VYITVGEFKGQFKGVYVQHGRPHSPAPPCRFSLLLSQYCSCTAVALVEDTLCLSCDCTSQDADDKECVELHSSQSRQEHGFLSERRACHRKANGSNPPAKKTVSSQQSASVGYPKSSCPLPGHSRFIVTRVASDSRLGSNSRRLLTFGCHGWSISALEALYVAIHT